MRGEALVAEALMHKQQAILVYLFFQGNFSNVKRIVNGKFAGF